jgi:hypothetical protein
VAQGKSIPSLKEVRSILFTFSLTVFAWIFFRSEDMTHAVQYIVRLFSVSLFSLPQIPLTILSISTTLFIIVFIVIEWIGREEQHALAAFGTKWPPLYRYAFYYGVILSIIFFKGVEQQFIYFQF